MVRYKDTLTQQLVWGDDKSLDAKMSEYVSVNEDGDDTCYFVKRKWLIEAPLTIHDDLMEF